jgi:hypothetical protein
VTPSTSRVVHVTAPASERAAEGYARMMSGAARFRVVLTTEA